jgi:1,2-diacylglycerol 3-alpha-glucosyltransferase
MKVLMLCDAFFDNLGYQENLLAKYYIRNGCDLTIIASNYDTLENYYKGNYNKDLPESTSIQNGYKVIRLKYRFFLFDKIKILKNITSILAEERPDLIFVHDILFNLHEVVNYKKQNKKCRLILDYHADYSNSANNWVSLHILHKIIRRSYLNLSLKHIDRIYPINTGSQIFLNEVYQIPNEQMEILPLGIDTDFTGENLKRINRNKIRSLYSIPLDAAVIFSGGKINRLKRTEDLLDSIIELNQPNLYLLLVGVIDNSDVEYKSLIKHKIMLNKNIIQVGWVDSEEVYQYMAASDFAIFPASQSVLWQQAIGMGLVTMLGKYVFVNNRFVDQHIEYLNANNNIIVLESLGSKKEEIVQKMKVLLQDRTLFETIKRNSIDFSEKYLSYSSVVKKTLLID